MMGGTLYGKGNLGINKEFNFMGDPESTYKVISSFNNMHILPWEAAADLKIAKSYHPEFFKDDNPRAKLFAEVNKGHYAVSNEIEM